MKKSQQRAECILGFGLFLLRPFAVYELRHFSKEALWILVVYLQNNNRSLVCTFPSIRSETIHPRKEGTEPPREMSNRPFFLKKICVAAFCRIPSGKKNQLYDLCCFGQMKNR